MTDDEMWDEIEAQLTAQWCDALSYDPVREILGRLMGLPEQGEAEKTKLDDAIASRAAGENALLWKLANG